MVSPLHSDPINWVNPQSHSKRSLSLFGKTDLVKALLTTRSYCKWNVSLTRTWQYCSKCIRLTKPESSSIGVILIVRSRLYTGIALQPKSVELFKFTSLRGVLDTYTNIADFLTKISKWCHASCKLKLFFSTWNLNLDAHTYPPRSQWKVEHTWPYVHLILSYSVFCKGSISCEKVIRD